MSDKPFHFELQHMNTVSGHFSRQATEIQNMINNLNNAKRVLDETWSGAGYDKFNQEMQSLMPHLVKLQQAMTEASKLTKTMSTTITDFQQRAANAIQSGLGG